MVLALPTGRRQALRGVRHRVLLRYALIKPPEEHSTPGSLKALHVSLVKPVAYLKERVRLPDPPWGRREWSPRAGGSPEVEQTYTRARALCQQVGETPQLIPTLRGLTLLYELGQGFCLPSQGKFSILAELFL